MVRVKICGITNISDAYRGCRMRDRCPRVYFLSEESEVCPAGESKRDHSKTSRFDDGWGSLSIRRYRKVKEIARFCDLSLIQLHGDESPRYCSQFPSSSLIKAVSP